VVSLNWISKVKKMRPITENGTGKTPKKRQHTKRGQKAINGVKKTITKAKTTAVKTKRKIQAGQNGEEVVDLLEQTTNGQPGTPVGNKVIEKTTKASTASKQMKKLKSLVQVQASGESPRRSKRISQKAGIEMDTSEVSVAQEASEVDGKITNGSTANGTSSKNGGLFQRTISKIWRIPEGITGVAYSGIETPATPAAKKPAEEPVVDSTSKNGSCVIS
jgi:hypothetical protein